MKVKMKKLYRRLYADVKKAVIEEITQSLIPGEFVSEHLDTPMTSKEICNYYKISSSTLERYTRQGLKFQRKKKNCKRFFTKREFNNFINQNKKRKS